MPCSDTEWYHCVHSRCYKTCPQFSRAIFTGWEEYKRPHGGPHFHGLKPHYCSTAYSLFASTPPPPPPPLRLILPFSSRLLPKSFFSNVVPLGRFRFEDENEYEYEIFARVLNKKDTPESFILLFSPTKLTRSFILPLPIAKWLNF